MWLVFNKSNLLLAQCLDRDYKAVGKHIKISGHHKTTISGVREVEGGGREGVREGGRERGRRGKEEKFVTFPIIIQVWPHFLLLLSSPPHWMDQCRHLI